MDFTHTSWHYNWLYTNLLFCIQLTTSHSVACVRAVSGLRDEDSHGATPSFPGVRARGMLHVALVERPVESRGPYAQCGHVALVECPVESRGPYVQCGHVALVERPVESRGPYVQCGQFVCTYRTPSAYGDVPSFNIIRSRRNGRRKREEKGRVWEVRERREERRKGGGR